MSIEFDLVAQAVAAVRANGKSCILTPYLPEESVEFNELLIFLKPELTAKYPADRRTFDLCMSSLKAFECEVVAGRVLGARYLKRHRMIEAHYGLINSYSTGGYDALPSDARVRAIEAIRASGRPAETEVLGAHEVLERFPTVSAQDLLAWHDAASEPIRLASGAYAFFHEVGGVDALIIDGFHPAQLSHFYDTSEPIVVLVVRSSSAWEDLRIQMCGATNPARAVPGSIRHSLLMQRESLGLESFDSMRNGIHVSAGPVEAAVEISRYMSDPDTGAVVDFAATSFGSFLASVLDMSRVRAISRNAVVPTADEDSQPAFDATEHIDAKAAAALLT